MPAPPLPSCELSGWSGYSECIESLQNRTRVPYIGFAPGPNCSYSPSDLISARHCEDNLDSWRDYTLIIVCSALLVCLTIVIACVTWRCLRRGAPNAAPATPPSAASPLGRRQPLLRGTGSGQHAQPSSPGSPLEDNENGYASDDTLDLDFCGTDVLPLGDDERWRGAAGAVGGCAVGGRRSAPATSAGGGGGGGGSNLHPSPPLRAAAGIFVGGDRLAAAPCCTKRVTREDLTLLTLRRPRYAMLDAEILPTKELVAVGGRHAPLLRPHLFKNITRVNGGDISRVPRADLTLQLAPLTEVAITVTDPRDGSEEVVTLQKQVDEPVKVLLREKLILVSCKPGGDAAAAGLDAHAGKLLYALQGHRLHSHQDLKGAVDENADAAAVRLALQNDHALMHLACIGLQQGTATAADARNLGGSIEEYLGVPICCLAPPPPGQVIVVPKQRGDQLSLDFAPTYEILGCIEGKPAAASGVLPDLVHHNILKVGQQDTRHINETDLQKAFAEAGPLELVVRQPLSGDKQAVVVPKEEGDDLGLTVKGKVMLRGCEAGSSVPGIARHFGWQVLSIAGVELRGADSLDEAMHIAQNARSVELRVVEDHALVHLREAAEAASMSPQRGLSDIESYFAALSLPRLGSRLHRKGFEICDVTDALLQRHGATLLERGIVTAALKLNQGPSAVDVASSAVRPSFRKGFSTEASFRSS